MHKRQKTEKSSTGEAEKSSKAEVEKSSMCDAHSERQRVSGGDVYKQMVVDQDVVDTRRHPGGVGKSSKSKAPEQQLCSGARGRTILYTQLWTDFLVSCLFKDHHVVYHHVCLFYHMYF